MKWLYFSSCRGRAAPLPLSSALWPPQVPRPAPGPPALMNSDNTYKNWWPPKDSSMQAVVRAGSAHRNRSTLWEDTSSRRVSAERGEKVQNYLSSTARWRYSARLTSAVLRCPDWRLCVTCLTRCFSSSSFFTVKLVYIYLFFKHNRNMQWQLGISHISFTILISIV